MRRRKTHTKRTIMHHIHRAMVVGLVIGVLLGGAALFSSHVLQRTFASSASYYVASGGNDSNSGSSSSPFSSISKAISVVTAGDTIYVGPGSYAPVTLSKSGASGSPITIRGDHASIAGGSVGMTISGSYLDISGFDVSRSDRKSVV